METGSLEVGDAVYVIGVTTGVVEDTVRELRVDLAPVPSVSKGQLFSMPVGTPIRRSDKLYKICPVT